MAVGSFSAGLSGLNANSTALSVIGNNLANINTVGFKASSVSFMDLVSQTVASAGSTTQVGLGVVTGAVAPVFAQGSIENSREATNVAIQGSGLYVLRSPGGATSYTRAGNFSFNRDGKLVTPDGHFVQGYTSVDASGAVVTSGALSDISIPPGVLREPQATTRIATTTNLNASAAAADTFATSVQIYDALGAPHVATITYTKQAAAGTWNYAVTVPGGDITGGTPGTPYQVGTGSVVFNSSGVLTTVNGGAPADVAITTPTWTNGASASTWNWDIVDTAGDPTLSGFASPSATSAIAQNGAAPGMVDLINVGGDGTITASLGGGQSMAIAQLALANFNNTKGLVKLGSNRYAGSDHSGTANVGTPGTGGRGTLVGSALEQSNVDMAQEFTQMILAQRGYQANSKSITVSDELLLETLNLKR